MTVTYTFDVSSLDGFGSVGGGDWGGYWGKQRPDCSTAVASAMTSINEWCSAVTPIGGLRR